jgi:GxxExxY protein
MILIFGWVYDKMVYTYHQFEETSHRIIGSAITVHKILGPGFLENIYHNALKKELELRNIPFEAEKKIKIMYKGTEIGEHRLDLLVNGEIIVELKAANKLIEVHEAQLLSYLKASGIRVGLLINFSNLRVDVKRYVYD